MTGSKRQRDLARAKYERQAARRTQSAHRRQRNQRIVAAVVVVALVLGSVAWIVLAQGSEDAPAPVAATGLDCREPGTPRPDNLTYGSAPTTDGAAATSITLTTNCGDIVIGLDHDAPKTVASEVGLAQNAFYDATSCHRLTTAGIFVLQCGDPAGNGSGGPGYVVPDENLPSAGPDGTATYPAGTVAMANAGPGTSGSQFFIVYQDSPLPPGYTVWGSVTSGLDIVRAVAAAGTVDGGGDGAPLQPVFVESASVQRS